MPPPRYHAQRGRPRGEPRPAGIAYSKYDPELGAAICARLAAGESMVAICGDDLSQPSPKTIWYWARRHPEFRLILDHARAVARAAAIARGQAVEAAMIARADVSRLAGYRGKPCRYTPQLAEAICDRLIEGETLEAIHGDPLMPSKTTIYRWLRREPDFLAEYRLARKVAADVLLQRAQEDSPWVGSYHASMRVMARRIREAERSAARLGAQQYAEAEGPARLNVIVEEADGSKRVIYDAVIPSPEGRG